MAGLTLENLGVLFRDDEMRRLFAVRDISLTLPEASITCLVGESGCGKSLTARACMGLAPRKSELLGRVLWNDKNLLELSEREWQKLRGNRMAMIFQEPMTALNPVLKVGVQAAEPLRYHKGLGKREAREKVTELFAQVGIPSPRERYELYPHELSGGMRQGQILAILEEQCSRRGMAVLLITHDLGVVARTAERVGVMYAGHLVEWGSVAEVLQNPAHPYTRGLMACDPARVETGTRLPVIAGTVPPLGAMPAGCPFHPRCPQATDICKIEAPCQKSLGEHKVWCHLA